MKRRIARALRDVAQRIDPQPKVSPWAAATYTTTANNVTYTLIPR